MKSKTRYRCRYCGTDDICDTLPSWELVRKKCKKCNHGKFKEKKMPESTDVYGYEKTEKTLWGDE